MIGSQGGGRGRNGEWAFSGRRVSHGEEGKILEMGAGGVAQ